MRINGFGKRYCHTVDEARATIEAHGRHVHVDMFWIGNDSCGDPECECYEKPSAEVLDNESGETVCYIEADTSTEIQAIIAELGIEVV